MAINMDVLGPQGDDELEAFAIEALVFAVQLELQKAIKDGKLTFAQLAEKLDMSPARVSQIFSSKGPNLTLKTIARIAFAVGTELSVVRKNVLKSKEAQFKPEEAPLRQLLHVAAQRRTQSAWKEVRPHNYNAEPRLEAA